MQMEYGQAIRFPQQDRGWIVKLLIASVLSLIPVLGQIVVAGYGQEISRRVYNDNVRPLPDWSDWGGLLGRGVRWLIVVFLYLLPLSLIGALLAGVNWGIDQAILSNGADEQIRSVGLALSLCVNVLLVGYGILASLSLIAATGRMAVQDRFGAAFQLGAIWGDIRRQPGLYISVLIMNVVAFALLPALGAIACGVGALAGLAYATWISAYLAGEAYQVSRSHESDIES